MLADDGQKLTTSYLLLLDFVGNEKREMSDDE